MKNKYLILMLICLSLLAHNSAGQQANCNTCQMIKTELKSFIDTTKLTKGDKGEHSVYVLNIYEDKPNNLEFRLNSFSDMHLLEDMTWNYFAIIDSEIVLIQNLGLESISLIQCISPQMASEDSFILVKKKLYNMNTFITGVEMHEVCRIKDGKLTKSIYPGRG